MREAEREGRREGGQGRQRGGGTRICNEKSEGQNRKKGRGDAEHACPEVREEMVSSFKKQTHRGSHTLHVAGILLNIYGHKGKAFILQTWSLREDADPESQNTDAIHLKYIIKLSGTVVFIFARDCVLNWKV